ncbi:hypothetical protein ANANG_G00167370 [Anguilla anguilla]|uniref:Uncharacterized protein n=1 Tax=Anguilla anguilla TaxID=7936 RepID=A0A9D3RVQ5_ANGAN|nr:hypothetical protein ANANG_G00167370 [Anguilla anguilla]
MHHPAEQFCGRGIRDSAPLDGLNHGSWPPASSRAWAPPSWCSGAVNQSQSLPHPRQSHAKGLHHPSSFHNGQSARGRDKPELGKVSGQALPWEQRQPRPWEQQPGLHQDYNSRPGGSAHSSPHQALISIPAIKPRPRWGTCGITLSSPGEFQGRNALQHPRMIRLRPPAMPRPLMAAQDPRGRGTPAMSSVTLLQTATPTPTHPAPQTKVLEPSHKPRRSGPGTLLCAAGTEWVCPGTHLTGGAALQTSRTVSSPVLGDFGTGRLHHAHLIMATVTGLLRPLKPLMGTAGTGPSPHQQTTPLCLIATPPTGPSKSGAPPLYLSTATPPRGGDSRAGRTSTRWIGGAVGWGWNLRFRTGTDLGMGGVLGHTSTSAPTDPLPGAQPAPNTPSASVCPPCPALEP